MNSVLFVQEVKRVIWASRYIFGDLQIHNYSLRSQGNDQKALKYDLLTKLTKLSKLEVFSLIQALFQFLRLNEFLFMLLML